MTYVVTHPESGWDCIIGLYEADSEEQVKEYVMGLYDISEEKFEDKYVIHQENIEKLN